MSDLSSSSKLPSLLVPQHHITQHTHAHTHTYTAHSPVAFPFVSPIGRTGQALSFTQDQAAGASLTRSSRHRHPSDLLALVPPWSFSTQRHAQQARLFHI